MHKKTMKNVLLKIFQGCQGIRRIMISKFLASKPKQTNLSNDIKPQNLMVLDIFVLRCCILFANFLPLINHNSNKSRIDIKEQTNIH